MKLPLLSSHFTDHPLQCVPWGTHQNELIDIRKRVFIIEQGVSYEEELDGKDELESTRHFLLLHRDKPIGTARILLGGKIGRIAIDKEYREKGLGRFLLLNATNNALEIDQIAKLDAQEYALEFYSKNGFEICSKSFIDAGIPHQSMIFDPSNSASLNKLYRDTVVRLNSKSEFNQHIDQHIASAQRAVDLFTTDMSFCRPDALLGAHYQNTLRDNLSVFARKNRQTRIRLLIKDSSSFNQHSQLFIQLAQRLPSKFQIRVLSDSNEKVSDAFLCSDERLVYFNDENTLNGFANYRAKAEVIQLKNRFEQLWNHSSQDDPNLKRLML